MQINWEQPILAPALALAASVCAVRILRGAHERAGSWHALLRPVGALIGIVFCAITSRHDWRVFTLSLGDGRMRVGHACERCGYALLFEMVLYESDTHNQLFVDGLEKLGSLGELARAERN